MTMTRRHALRDDQWERIKDILPGKPSDVGVTAKDNRLFVEAVKGTRACLFIIFSTFSFFFFILDYSCIEAVLYRYKTGIPWRDLPERFGDFRVIHTRFSRWSKKGVWEQVFNQLSEQSDDEYAMLDATIVKAHQHSAGKKGIKPLDAAKVD